jgi:hypothetical protein
MLSDRLTFKFLLTIIDSCELSITVGDQTTSQKFDELGPVVFPITFQTDVNQSYAVALTTTATHPVAFINNVEVVWHDDEKISPVWRIPGDNEVWDYIDSDATKRVREFETSPSLRTMSLDYMIDGRFNGYLNNFGEFVTANNETRKLINNGNRLFVLQEPGCFVFKFRSPIAYWLFKRLFVRPLDQTQG